MIANYAKGFYGGCSNQQIYDEKFISKEIKIMTKREAAIVSAYTGCLIGEFSDFHAYAEEVIGRPILEHNFSSVIKKVKDKNKNKIDFMNIKIESDAKKEPNQREILGGYRKCKYGDCTKFGLRCEYSQCMTYDDDYKFPCPPDSGTDGKRNGICYEYANFRKE